MATRTDQRWGERRPRVSRDAGLLGEVVAGLGRRQRALPSWLFYDDRGSRLFQWITNLPGYYLTRVERRILETHGEAIVAPLGLGPCTVVDLGAGDGHKTRLLLELILRRGARVTYAPVDLSRAALEEAAERVRAELPEVALRPVAATYVEAITRLTPRIAPGPKLVLFLGSSIGNLEHAAARRLLRDLRSTLRPGDHLLVGFDLVKPPGPLRRAYDDPQGVTAAFNLNLLARLNRELGASFDLSAFRHVATWDPIRPAMESWLESRHAQTVRMGPYAFTFGAGERIHTEISCKYTEAQITRFATACGFAEVGRFADPARWFVDVLWSADR
jgi:L-histidine Nalpha-methyltransferase